MSYCPARAAHSLSHVLKLCLDVSFFLTKSKLQVAMLLTSKPRPVLRHLSGGGFGVFGCQIIMIVHHGKREISALSSNDLVREVSTIARPPRITISISDLYIQTQDSHPESPPFHTITSFIQLFDIVSIYTTSYEPSSRYTQPFTAIFASPSQR